MPGLSLDMDGAEPPPTDTAVESCGRIAGLIQGRNGLTRPLEVPDSCLIHLFQQFPTRAGSIHLAVATGSEESVPKTVDFDISLGDEDDFYFCWWTTRSRQRLSSRVLLVLAMSAVPRPGHGLEPGLCDWSLARFAHAVNTMIDSVQCLIDSS